jgi:hypothetical protein
LLRLIPGSARSFSSGVDDEARLGARRFAKEVGGRFLRSDGVDRIPPVVKLPQVLATADHFEEESIAFPRRTHTLLFLIDIEKLRFDFNALPI